MLAKHKLIILFVLAIIINSGLTKNVKLPSEGQDEEGLDNTIEYDLEEGEQDGEKLIPSLIKVIGPNKTAQSALIIVPSNYSGDKDQADSENHRKYRLGYTYGEMFIYVIEKAYEWAEDKRPLIELIIKVGRAVTKDKSEQMPTSKMILDVLETVIAWKMEQAKEEFLKTYSNYTIADIIKKIEKHCNLTQALLKPQFVEKLMTLPGVNDLVESAVVADVNGTPFPFALMELVEHLKNGVTLGQLSEGSVIPEIYKNVTEVVSPFVDVEMSKFMLKVREDLHMVVDNFTDVEQVKTRFNSFIKNVTKQITDNLTSSKVKERID